jgi:hypothetical protein
MYSSKVVPRHITICHENIDLYEGMMKNARIPSQIVRHLRTIMDQNNNTYNKDQQRYQEASVSYILYKEIASTRNFDRYGRPMV